MMKVRGPGDVAGTLHRNHCVYCSCGVLNGLTDKNDWSQSNVLDKCNTSVQV
jgi:hypothetical protein